MPSQTTTEPQTRRYRATVRTRLALTYSALLTGAGLVMLTIVYVFMRFVPTYDLVPSDSFPTEPMEPGISTPMPEVTGGTTPASTTTPASEILITSTEQLLNLLLVVSLIVLIVLAVVGIAVGWAVAGRMLRPLQYINGAARKAAHGDLAQRIRLEGPRDEISELAANFDDMLAQLERSFAASKRFASNASHELLTPLATTRAMLDVAIAQRDDPAERALFDRLRAMNERSIETAEALLGLAQIEGSTVAGERVDLARVAAEVAEFCADEAVGAGATVTLDLRPAPFDGEPVLTRQLVTNLVQNAIRHNAASDGFLTIVTRTAPDGSAVIEVENSGAIFEADAVTALAEPFTRAAGRRSTSEKGHGLGLSIVSAIVTRFHGALVLTARPTGGLRVIVTFPAEPAPR